MDYFLFNNLIKKVKESRLMMVHDFNPITQKTEKR